MEIVLSDLSLDILNLFVKVLSFLIVLVVFPRVIKFLFGCLDYASSDIDVDIFTKADIQEVKEPEKPKETVVKMDVINSPVKMQPVSDVRKAPKLCPYCLGVPDNDERCSYCGIKF